MKKLILIIAAIILLTLPCFSQHISLGALGESTASGYQYGGFISAENSKQWGLGGFYQVDVRPASEASLRNSFYGFQLQVPLVKSQRLLFAGVLRAGLVNDKFAVVVPGLETHINAGRRFAMAFGIGMRVGYPSISSKLICKLF